MSSKAVWNGYLQGLTSKDLGTTLKHHDPEAIMRIVDVSKPHSPAIAIGAQSLPETMGAFMATLGDLKGFAIAMEEIDTDVIPGMSQIFAAWHCHTSGIQNVTETLLIDDATNSILSHNIVVSR